MRTLVSVPIFMIAPLPCDFSIWAMARFSAFFFSSCFLSSCCDATAMVPPIVGR